MNRIILAPKRARYVLVFDVETNGLLPKKRKFGDPPAALEEYPHILQLSYVVYDLESNEIKETFDTYIKVAENVEINELITGLTGITRELCQTKGIPITDALNNFYGAYMLCERMVAHNIDFDEKMITVEIQRNWDHIVEYVPRCVMIFNHIYEEIQQIQKYCTMRKGTNIYNTTEKKRKFPKLSELYLTLFENEELPKNLHNSMVDVMVCLRCYLKMRHGYSNTSSYVSSSSSNINAIAA